MTVQHEQLREAALHSELAELDGVLHRQYEQYKQSKENIRLINRRYHELKMQIAAIRAERDHAKQDVALAAMESGIRQRSGVHHSTRLRCRNGGTRCGVIIDASCPAR